VNLLSVNMQIAAAASPTHSVIPLGTLAVSIFSV
jgi:hypothetical protein